MSLKKFPLKKPFEYGGDRITELKFSTNPKVKHILNINMDDPTLQDVFEFVANLGGYDIDMISELSFEDVGDIQEFAIEQMGKLKTQPD